MSQTFTGTVIGLKSVKTATVEVVSTEIHPRYHKPISRRKKIQAHNPQYSLEIGDKVVIKSSRPFSATKRFLVINKI
jgi:small subunit ribosomal protein S17